MVWTVVHVLVPTSFSNSVMSLLRRRFLSSTVRRIVFNICKIVFEKIENKEKRGRILVIFTSFIAERITVDKQVTNCLH